MICVHTLTYYYYAVRIVVTVGRVESNISIETGRCYRSTSVLLPQTTDAKFRDEVRDSITRTAGGPLVEWLKRAFLQKLEILRVQR